MAINPKINKNENQSLTLQSRTHRAQLKTLKLNTIRICNHTNNCADKRRQTAFDAVFDEFGCKCIRFVYLWRRLIEMQKKNWKCSLQIKDSKSPYFQFKIYERRVKNQINIDYLSDFAVLIDICVYIYYYVCTNWSAMSFQQHRCHLNIRCFALHSVEN